RERPRRLAANLCDERPWRRREAHLFWRRTLFDAGLVAQGRLHRLHQAGQRQFRDRRDEDGRLGRAHPHRRVPQRGPDLGAQRALPDVLSRSGRQRRAEDLHGRRLRPLRDAGADAGLRVRSRLGPAAGVRGAARAALSRAANWRKLAVETVGWRPLLPQRTGCAATLMRDQKHIAWLYEQLPGLVSDGTLSSDAAQRLRQRYGEAEGGRGQQAATLFGVLGAVLVGGGIILLLAHNWDDFSRPTRAALSFAPLVLAQALAGFALWRRPDSVPWREGAGAFLTLAIGASIALIAQTYNISGDLGDFLLTWTLLALPVAYVLGATLPAILYLFGIAAWAGAQWTSNAEALGY